MDALVKSGLLGSFGLVAILALTPWSTNAEHSSAPSANLLLTQCEATFDPDTIQQGDVHEEVHVHLSEPIGEIDDVEVPDESDLDVLWVHDDEEDEPQEGRVRLSAIRAEIGEWTLHVQGEMDTCEGQITVVEETF